MSRKYSTLSLNKGQQPILSDVKRFVNTTLFHKLPYRDSRRHPQLLATRSAEVQPIACPHFSSTTMVVVTVVAVTAVSDRVTALY